MQDNRIKIVGILRGGVGGGYEKSLREGGEIFSILNEKLLHKWKPVDILIDKEGVWHLAGIPVKPADLVNKVDVVWNTAQPVHANILQNISIPHVGHSIFSKTIGESKEMLQEHMSKIGLKMPRHFVIPTYQPDFDGDKNKYIIKKAQEVLNKFPAPWIVKTFTPDSNTGIHLVKTYPELIDAIEDVVNHNRSILVEEFISGKIASVHSLASFRNEEYYTFPVDNLKKDEKKQLEKLSKEIHKHIGANHYLRSDFVLSNRGNIYLINIELTPDFNVDSHFHNACISVGTGGHNIIDHILESSL